MSDKRDSIASDAVLIVDPQQQAIREAENAIRQFDRVLDMIDDVARAGQPFKLRPSKILDLHRCALEGLSAYAGNFRPGPVIIGQSKHTPPDAFLVAELIEDMCEHVNANWLQQSAVELCAYVMWRLNWIHPFADGNGRTSRALAYLVLCAKVGDRLPGRKTLPEQIAENKGPYYEALEKADAAFSDGIIDISAMRELLENYLALQLKTAFDAARSTSSESSERKFH